jgi:hypothetical protein
MQRIYGVAVEMGSGAMIYTPSFIKIGSGIEIILGRGGIDKMEIA